MQLKLRLLDAEPQPHKKLNERRRLPYPIWAAVRPSFQITYRNTRVRPELIVHLLAIGSVFE
jgi:hypothetical protein